MYGNMFFIHNTIVDIWKLLEVEKSVTDKQSCGILNEPQSYYRVLNIDCPILGDNNRKNVG